MAVHQEVSDRDCRFLNSFNIYMHWFPELLVPYVAVHEEVSGGLVVIFNLFLIYIYRFPEPWVPCAVVHEEDSGGIVVFLFIFNIYVSIPQVSDSILGCVRRHQQGGSSSLFILIYMCINFLSFWVYTWLC